MKVFKTIAAALIVVSLLAVSIHAAGLSAVDGSKAKTLTLSASKATKQTAHAGKLETAGEIIDPSTYDAALRDVGEAMQGGDNIATAAVISSMPFSTTGTTDGYTDDYDEDCGGEGAQGLPDVVYKYTPQHNELVDIVTCASSYFTRIWVYQTDENTLIACNRFAAECGQPPRAALYDVPMDSAQTYYIVIDGDDLIAPGYGTYDLQCTAVQLIDLEDSTFVHPAIADNGNGFMVLAYDQTATDTLLLWTGSIDDGLSFLGVGAWIIDAGYPAVDYWGNDVQFYSALVPDATENSGGRTYLVEIDNPANSANWSLVSWNWTQHGWHDMLSCDIACDNGQEEWKWGIQSFISSTTYTDPPLTNGPHILYPTDTNTATISWFSIPGCATTTCDIDPVNARAYSVYDYYDTDENVWGLFLRRDYFQDMSIASEGWTFTVGETGSQEHAQYPAIAADNGNLLIVTEYWDEAAGNDRDIICWYTSDSDIVNLEQSTVVSTTDMERYPRISHVSGDYFLCTFVRGDTLFQVVTEDAGVTWGTPEPISTSSDLVVNEYRTSDISENAGKAVWEYRNAGDPDTSIFIHFGDIDVTVDADADGVADDIDNCPGVYNPLQEDGDFDGVGTLCDNCPDFFNPDQGDDDGDGVGNNCDLCEGYDDNQDADGDGVPDGCDICPGHNDNDDFDGDNVPDSCDNCPEVANPGQEDANSNGIGDACDYIPGDANHDGVVNVGDAVHIINYVFKEGSAPDPLEAGDANCDGVVNVGDAVHIINYVFKEGDPPGCP